MADNPTFSFSAVANNFDEHINSSIRGYNHLRDDVVGISKHFIINDTNVVDIGCSAGTILKRIKDYNSQAPTANYVGIEINDDFKQHWIEDEPYYLTKSKMSETAPNFPICRWQYHYSLFNLLLRETD